MHTSERSNDVRCLCFLSTSFCCQCGFIVQASFAFCQMIKETMDKKFGAPWHVVAGGYFSYDITFEVRLTAPVLYAN